MPGPFDGMTTIEAVSFVCQALLIAGLVGLVLAVMSLWGKQKRGFNNDE